MIVGTILYALLYIGIIYASLCLGYIHPFFWVYASLVSSVFAGIPYLYLTARWQKFGVGTLFAFLVAGGTILNWGLILLIGIMTDVIRRAIGNKRIAGVRISYLLLALIPFGRTIVIWTDRTKEIAEQAAEMGKAYGDTMEAITPIWMLVVMIIITVVVAFLAERIVEKCMKKSACLMEA
ncbi:MAG: hypothetical protein BHV88_24280 [Clostridiales bacterium 41_12_two_minus]|nr:MAG: hypothetical protein BHV88_24280 [Clostridiales bacterium 41_12_two_minus]